MGLRDKSSHQERYLIDISLLSLRSIASYAYKIGDTGGLFFVGLHLCQRQDHLPLQASGLAHHMHSRFRFQIKGINGHDLPLTRVVSRKITISMEANEQHAGAELTYRCLATQTVILTFTVFSIFVFSSITHNGSTSWCSFDGWRGSPIGLGCWSGHGK